MDMAPIPEPVETLAEETAEQRTQRQLAVLRRLTEIGMVLAEKVAEQAEAVGSEGEAVADPAELALVFSRLSRAVRQTVGLEARIAEGRMLTRRRDVEDQRRTEIRDAWRTRKADIFRVAGQAIEAAPDDRFDTGVAYRRLSYHLDCLDERDDIERLLDRPIGALVAKICHDLELDPDWNDWADEDWAIAEFHAKAPGSPFVRYKPPGPGDAEDDAPP